ncbi:MAG: class I SAM-dependent methyltransferase [Armatimonadota bacterium]
MPSESLEFTGERVVEGDTPERVWQEHVARYRFAASRASNKEVLDVACGTGYGSRMMLDAGARRVVGVDISPEAIAYARSRYATDRLTFAVGEAADLDGLGQFDLIVCYEAIEHVADAGACVAAAAGALRPGGQYLVSTPNVSPVLARMGKSSASQFHRTDYDARSFRQVLEPHFADIALFGQVWYPLTRAGKALWWLRRKLNRLPRAPRPLGRHRGRSIPFYLVAICRDPRSP